MALVRWEHPYTTQIKEDLIGWQLVMSALFKGCPFLSSQKKCDQKDTHLISFNNP